MEGGRGTIKHSQKGQLLMEMCTIIGEEMRRRRRGVNHENCGQFQITRRVE